MDRATPDNPTGAHSYDHSAFAHLAEYQHLADAVQPLIRAVRNIAPDMAYDDFIQTVADISASPTTRDNCPECSRNTQPYRIDLDRDGAGAFCRYRCPGCGNTWTCGWLLNRPSFAA